MVVERETGSKRRVSENGPLPVSIPKKLKSTPVMRKPLGSRNTTTVPQVSPRLISPTLASSAKKLSKTSEDARFHKNQVTNLHCSENLSSDIVKSDLTDRDADAALTKVWALTEKVTETEKTNRQLKAYLRSSLQIIKKGEATAAERDELLTRVEDVESHLVELDILNNIRQLEAKLDSSSENCQETSFPVECTGNAKELLVYRTMYEACAHQLNSLKTRSSGLEEEIARLKIRISRMEQEFESERVGLLQEVDDLKKEMEESAVLHRQELEQFKSISEMRISNLQSQLESQKNQSSQKISTLEKELAFQIQINADLIDKNVDTSLTDVVPSDCSEPN